VASQINIKCPVGCKVATAYTQGVSVGNSKFMIYEEYGMND